MTAAEDPHEPRTRQRFHAGTAIALALVAALSGCAAPSLKTPTPALPASLPAQWQAPLPHGASVAELSKWWQHFDDPLLVHLIAAAQEASPTLASAAARIEQARATRIGKGAVLVPAMSAGLVGSRGRQEVTQPMLSSGSAGLQLAWEIDVFGANRAAASAAQARLEGAQALWHDARVTVAAEVANVYTSLRACHAIRAQIEIDAASRAETARLTALTADRGLQAPAHAALARASAAQGQVSLQQQAVACESQIKALVALTAVPEPELRAALGTSSPRVPQAAAFAVDQVPAAALAQRPDLASAAREVIAASADIHEADAQRYPRITLAGSIGAARVNGGPGSSDGTTWSLGPLQLTLPVFDAGVRRANVQAAQARHEAAASQYRAALRNAVRDVEQALVALHGTASRAQDAQAAADGFRASFLAAQARHRGGLASLFELEDARRSDVQAQTALIELQRERALAWTALYRALGGGWDGARPERTASNEP
jgi:multidrug efflux system outer membrane protein